MTRTIFVKRFYVHSGPNTPLPLCKKKFARQVSSTITSSRQVEENQRPVGVSNLAMCRLVGGREMRSRQDKRNLGERRRDFSKKRESNPQLLTFDAYYLGFDDKIGVDNLLPVDAVLAG